MRVAGSLIILLFCVLLASCSPDSNGKMPLTSASGALDWPDREERPAPKSYLEKLEFRGFKLDETAVVGFIENHGNRTVGRIDLQLFFYDDDGVLLHSEAGSVRPEILPGERFLYRESPQPTVFSRLPGNWTKVKVRVWRVWVKDTPLTIQEPND